MQTLQIVYYGALFLQTLQIVYYCDLFLQAKILSHMMMYSPKTQDRQVNSAQLWPQNKYHRAQTMPGATAMQKRLRHELKISTSGIWNLLA